MKKVVVTGGAGFIGSHLVESLSSQGYHVIILDDLSTGNPANIEILLKKKNVEFINDSINNSDLLQEIFQDVSSVFHLAAIPSVPRSIDKPIPSHEVNATGTLNILWAAMKQGVSRLIYSSSSSVYGDTPVLPKEESMIPNPQSPYAVSKLAGEYYSHVFSSVYGLSTICLRYFNVFGPGQNPESQYAAVIPKFIKSCFNNESPVIYGDGEQTRDFTYVEDVVSANILAEKSTAQGIVNISRGESISLNKLAEYIIKLTGSSVKPVFQNPRPGDIKHSLADITKAGTIGYAPRYDLKTGLTETVRWFKDTKWI